jgi:hypothetical protein
MCGYSGILILGRFWRHVVVHRVVGIDLGELGIDLVHLNYMFSTVQSYNRYHFICEINKYLKCSKRLAKCNRDVFWRNKEEVRSLSW